MNRVISEKDYSVQGKWIFKSALPALLLLIILGSLWLSGTQTRKMRSYLVVLTIFTPIHFVTTMLRRATFRYAIEDKFLTPHQGIPSKQQRHIPYGVIQNIFVKQDLLDRIFGLASVTIENASQGAGAVQGETAQEMAGFSGNKVSIPGLTQSDAETLKGLILAKMKENPIEDSQSGL